MLRNCYVVLSIEFNIAQFIIWEKPVKFVPCPFRNHFMLWSSAKGSPGHFVGKQVPIAWTYLYISVKVEPNKIARVEL